MTASDAPMREWGPPRPGELDRVVVVSPHLDDAVLGCAHLLASVPGSTVVTVFAGNPPAYPEPMRPWDVISGFAPGEDVMEARRKEDHAALTVLDATPVHLDFVEYSYNRGDRPTPPEEVAPRLGEALRALAPSLICAPFGLANPDHDVVHQACMRVREEYEDASWWCYEDFGYKHIPGMLAWRVSQLFRRSLWPTPVCPTVALDEARKQRAVACYPTQVRALETDWLVSDKLVAPAPEQYWRIESPPPGWEGFSAS